MALTSLFIVISVGILAFAIITRPFHEGVVEEVHSHQLFDEEELPALHEKMTAWLKDLGLEFTTGKLDKQDYLLQKSVLEKEIAQLEDRLNTVRAGTFRSGEKEIESMIINRRKMRVERSSGFCVQCGAPLNSSDLFCSKCGLKLK
jgi:hypothetical protein